MNKIEIIKKVDHTVLSQNATMQEILTAAQDAIDYSAASLCIAPCYVHAVKEAFNSLNVCTVIGFPLGYSKSEIKAFEATEAIKDGATEIDMVLNVIALKSKDFSLVEKELKLLRKVVCGENILKLIVETSLLDTDEKILMCKLVSDNGIDYIKTSTGFSGKGATVEDVKLFKKYISQDVKIKASGGIGDFVFASELIKAGADRIGASRLIKQIKESSHGK